MRDVTIKQGYTELQFELDRLTRKCEQQAKQIETMREALEWIAAASDVPGRSRARTALKQQGRGKGDA